jgi:uncharacterized membrane protein YqgA involved in biofilm formation
MMGTWINVGTVLMGGCLGSWLGDRLPQRLREIVMQGIGLVTLAIGMSMALKTTNPLFILGSILIGGILGEWWTLQSRLNAIGMWLEIRTAKHPFLARGDFIRGFVTATLVFCVGPMTVLGSTQEGLSGDASLLIVKSVLDGFTALAFAAAMGMGVTFAALSVLLIQGTLTLGGALFAQILTPLMITELTATGGVMILGIGLLLLEIKSIRIANFLPALIVAPCLVALWKLAGW